MQTQIVLKLLLLLILSRLQLLVSITIITITITMLARSLRPNTETKLRNHTAGTLAARIGRLLSRAAVYYADQASNVYTYR